MNVKEWLVFIVVLRCALGATTFPGTTTRPGATTTPTATNYQRLVDETPWTWDDKAATLDHALRQSPPTQLIVVKPQPSDFVLNKVLTISVTRGGKPSFSWTGHERSVFVTSGDRFVYADYGRITSGCTLVCVDLNTTRELWRADLQGVRRLWHSKYHNAVAIEMLDAGHVRVWGNEAFGRYVEIVDVTNGSTVGHKVFPVER